MFLVTLTCTVTRGKPDMPTLNPTSSPGLFAPPIFWGKSPRDEVALNPTLMALRLMAGTRPNFSYPNSCYMYVTSKYAEDSKHELILTRHWFQVYPYWHWVSHSQQYSRPLWSSFLSKETIWWCSQCATQTSQLTMAVFVHTFVVYTMR